MPQKAKKDHSCSHHSDSRWHSFHFSGKVIMCSVLFGFLLVLVGGIVMAIGMDEDEDKKPDMYTELQPKPPMSVVGPVVMGIGGFTVVVGVTMCMFETMCRKGDADSSPLIRDSDVRRDSSQFDPRSIPSTSGYQEEGRDKRRKDLGSKAIKKSKYKNKNNLEASYASSGSPSSVPIGINSKGYLQSSDTFMTPSSSLITEAMFKNPNTRDARNQTTPSLVTSHTSSGTWNVSTEFQTPSASFRDELTESKMQENLQYSPEGLNKAVSKKLEEIKHEFVTPQNSNIDESDSSSVEENEETPTNGNHLTDFDERSHAFLTPKSSTNILEEDDEIAEKSPASSTANMTESNHLQSNDKSEEKSLDNSLSSVGKADETKESDLRKNPGVDLSVDKNISASHDNQVAIASPHVEELQTVISKDAKAYKELEDIPQTISLQNVSEEHTDHTKNTIVPSSSDNIIL